MIVHGCSQVEAAHAARICQVIIQLRQPLQQGVLPSDPQELSSLEASAPQVVAFVKLAEKLVGEISELIDEVVVEREENG